MNNKNTTKKKMLLTHGTAMWYTIPFFEQIAQEYDLDLVFTHIHVAEELYNFKVAKKIPGLENTNYTILHNNYGFANGLIKKAKEGHDVTVGGSWDTLQELIETIILEIITLKKQEPFIIWREDWDWPRKKTIKEKLLKIVIKKIIKKADAIVVPGTLHKEYFQKLGVNENKIYIMPNVSNIKDDTVKPSLNSVNKKTILYVGRLIKRKGVNYLIDAYKQLVDDNINDTQLIIVGSGEERYNLEKQVKKYNLTKNIIFTGEIKNNELISYYKTAELVVVPSINYGVGDPWVFVVNEAMYFKNPVVVTDAVGASKDMVRDNGYIVKEKNSKELYVAMKKIITDSKLQKHMGDISKQIIEEEYRYNHMVSGFNKAVFNVLKEDNEN